MVARFFFTFVRTTGGKCGGGLGKRGGGVGRSGPTSSPFYTGQHFGQGAKGPRPHFYSRHYLLGVPFAGAHAWEPVPRSRATGTVMAREAKAGHSRCRH